MRLKLAGKIILFALVLAGLYAVWQRAPAQYRHPKQRWRLPGIEIMGGVGPSQRPSPRVRGAGGAPVVGFVPPQAPALGRLGSASRLLACASSPEALDRVGNGDADAAVVDLPAVVFAARGAGRPVPFRVVLLVGWRLGSDAVWTQGRGGWQPGQRMAFVRRTSGEYLARRTLDRMPWGPEEKATAKAAFMRVENPGIPPKDAGALAGRFRLRGPWRVWQSTADAPLPDRMPDVLVVSDEWARTDPAGVTALVVNWERAQSDLAPGSKGWRQYVKALKDPEAARQMAPASYADQRAFLGVERPGTYMALVQQQIRVLDGGGPTPPVVPEIRVDRQPFMVTSRPLVDGVTE